MASQNYLIAIALIEQNLVRAMPLGGKEIKDNLEESENLKKLGEEVILNLLMRVFQRSDEGALKRASEEKGLLLVHMHPKRMQKELPFIKSEWDKRRRHTTIFKIPWQSLQRSMDCIFCKIQRD